MTGQDDGAAGGSGLPRSQSVCTNGNPWTKGQPDETVRSDRELRGALLDHRIGLDGEDTTAIGDIEDLEQIRIQVQLVAIGAEGRGNGET